MCDSLLNIIGLNFFPSGVLLTLNTVLNEGFPVNSFFPMENLCCIGVLKLCDP